MDKKDLHIKNLSEKQLRELRAKNSDIRVPENDLRIDSFNKELSKSITNDVESIPSKSLKEIKKEYGLTDKDIAEIFDYKNVLSYRNSKAKQKIDTAIELLYKLFKYNK